MTRTFRWLGVAGAAVVIALSMAGCSPVNDLIGPVPTTETETDPEVVKARLATALDQAQEVLGGTWDEKDGKLANGCGPADDFSHFSYMSARYRNEPTADFIASTAALKAFWEEQGLSVEEISYDPHPSHPRRHDALGRRHRLQDRTRPGVADRRDDVLPRELG